MSRTATTTAAVGGTSSMLETTITPIGSTTDAAQNIEQSTLSQPALSHDANSDADAMPRSGRIPKAVLMSPPHSRNSSSDSAVSILQSLRTASPERALSNRVIPPPTTSVIPPMPRSITVPNPAPVVLSGAHWLQRCLDELHWASGSIQQLLSNGQGPLNRAQISHTSQRLCGVAMMLGDWSRSEPIPPPQLHQPYPVYIPIMGMQFPVSNGPVPPPMLRSQSQLGVAPVGGPPGMQNTGQIIGAPPMSIPPLPPMSMNMRMPPLAYPPPALGPQQLLAPHIPQNITPQPHQLVHSHPNLPHSIQSVKRTRKRQRLDTSNVQCQQCGTHETPEWRRGPDGARTLCNACGLYHAKVAKKKGDAEAAKRLRERRPLRLNGNGDTIPGSSSDSSVGSMGSPPAEASTSSSAPVSVSPVSVAP